MIKVLVSIAAAAAASAVAAGLAVREAGPSTGELDADIAAVRASIAAAQTDVSRFAGGLIHSQAEMRLVTLQATEAMLEQKRASLLRGIRMEFRDGAAMPQPSDEALSGIRREIERAEGDARAAAAEAARYSGGLVQGMALVREQTARATAAMLRQQEAALRLGLPIRTTTGGPAAPAQQAPGRSVPDRDAL